FAAGDLTQIITVGTANDSIDESNETVTVTLTNPSGAAQATPVIGTSAATGTIVDNDTATISIADTSITESSNLLFTVSRTTTSHDSHPVTDPDPMRPPPSTPLPAVLPPT